jgi:tRNA (cytidine/uridine-2'-O-)-methyltransferase
MRLALFQPDIPQNLGAAIRLAACLGVPLDIIEPCGFPLSARIDRMVDPKLVKDSEQLAARRALRRAAMDYAQIADVKRHASWSFFRTESVTSANRLVLFTTRGAQALHAFGFRASDILLFGRESAGVPDEIHASADARVVIPLAPGARSLNVVTAAAIALGEALRQTGGFAVNGFPSGPPTG